MAKLFALLLFAHVALFFSQEFDPTLPKPVNIVPLHEKRMLRRRGDRNLLGSEITPLYPGYGTHIAYIYVGTPPQRQSVIIDTGSAYTAFPCEGCKTCGQHTDNYFSPKNSSTAVVATCGKGTCSISQSYSEGSSWQAYKVTDKLWIGGLTSGLVKSADKYAVDFLFGCQTSETGLFRTQLADGIMGMSASPSTLLPQLKSHNIVDSKIFGLCFRVGGGIMTLGGIDQRIHSSDIQYAKLFPSSSGWFRVKVEGLSLKPGKWEGKALSRNISGADSFMNSGSGTIVDSGTTDTYFPSRLKAAFEKEFLAITGVHYVAGKEMSLSTGQIKSLPNIIVSVRNADDSGSFDLVIPVSGYADIEGGKYTFRIYLTEGSGSVLGANFMRNRNVIFDADGGRVGFAASSCNYEDYQDAIFDPPAPPFSLPPMPDPINLPKDKNNCTMEPAGYCSAVCERPAPGADQKKNDKDSNKDADVPAGGNNKSNKDASGKAGGNNGNSKDASGKAGGNNGNSKDAGSKSSGNNKSGSGSNSNNGKKKNGKRLLKTTGGAYVVEGEQTFYDYCTNTYEKRVCKEYCTADDEIARGVNVHCLHTAWSECDDSCTQHRTVGYLKDGVCMHRKEERVCAVDNCKQKTEDFFVFADLKFWYPAAVAPRHWEKIFEEDLFSALAFLLKVPAGNMDMLVDMEAHEEETRRLGLTQAHQQHHHTRQLANVKRFVKLQLQIVVSRQQYARVEYFNNAIQFILEMLDTQGFRLGEYLVPELVRIGKDRDGDRNYRYSMLYPEDVSVQRAVALPMGGIRDPINIPNAVPVYDVPPPASTFREYFLVGVALGSVLIMLVTVGLYLKLRSEHAALAKEKVLSSGSSILQMLKRVSGSNKGDRGKRTQPDRNFFPTARDGSSNDLLGNNDSDDENDQEYGL